MTDLFAAYIETPLERPELNQVHYPLQPAEREFHACSMLPSWCNNVCLPSMA